MSQDNIHKETTMQIKSWFNVPFNYFFVVFYLLLGASIAINPVNRQTTEIAGDHAAVAGRVVAVLFFFLSYVLWTNTPKDRWITFAALPGVVWGAYDMTFLLASRSNSWATAVFIGASLALLPLLAEALQRIYTHETLNEALLKENALLKLRVAELTPKVDDEPTGD